MANRAGSAAESAGLGGSRVFLTRSGWIGAYGVQLQSVHALSSGQCPAAESTARGTSRPHKPSGAIPAGSGGTAGPTVAVAHHGARACAARDWSPARRHTLLPVRPHP